jgi:ribosomal protein S18 acetylase RimI-like enzyme
VATIRRALLQDLPGAYHVCLATGDSGRDATALYGNPDLLGHVFVGPYVVGQPTLARVVVDAAGVAGYLLAAEDSRAFEAWAEAEWWPPLRAQYPPTVGDTPDDEVIRLLHAPPRAADGVVAAYPAHLHIDLLERVRGQGLGRRLIDGLIEDLRASAVPGVHLDVAADNPNAIAFYEHLGFETLERAADGLVMGRRLDSRR